MINEQRSKFARVIASSIFEVSLGHVALEVLFAELRSRARPIPFRFTLFQISSTCPSACPRDWIYAEIFEHPILEGMESCAKRTYVSCSTRILSLLSTSTDPNARRRVSYRRTLYSWSDRLLTTLDWLQTREGHGHMGLRRPLLDEPCDKGVRLVTIIRIAL